MEVRIGLQTPPLVEASMCVAPPFPARSLLVLRNAAGTIVLWGANREVT